MGWTHSGETSSRAMAACIFRHAVGGLILSYGFLNQSQPRLCKASPHGWPGCLQSSQIQSFPAMGRAEKVNWLQAFSSRFWLSCSRDTRAIIWKPCLTPWLFIYVVTRVESGGLVNVQLNILTKVGIIVTIKSTWSPFWGANIRLKLAGHGALWIQQRQQQRPPGQFSSATLVMST